MKKIKGSLSKPEPFAIIAAASISLCALLPLRVYQVAKLIDPETGFFSLMGIKTPGLTCARELGYHVASRCAEELTAEKNPAFNPIRKNKVTPNGPVICRCEQITEAEIRNAIARGATTVDGVKRRAGSGMGRCQGSRCSMEIERLLEASRHGTI